MKKLFILSNFYEFSSRTEEKEIYRAFKMRIEKDTLEFNAYNDYYYDTIDLPAVYLTNRELKKIKKTTLPIKKNEQILFLHNDTPYYLNIVGFFYPDLYLKEIHSPDFEFSPIMLSSGLGFNYTFHNKKVADFYVPYSDGILRFIAVGNPEWSGSDRFDKEIDYMFFVLNSKMFRPKD